jgi:hypothetical protein
MGGGGKKEPKRNARLKSVKNAFNGLTGRPDRADERIFKLVCDFKSYNIRAECWGTHL